MTEAEFARQYGRMVDFYGDKGDNHYQAWRDKFGKWDCVDFAEAIALVIDNHRAYGADKWPTVGDFNHIINSQERPEQPEPYRNLSDNERDYQTIRWKMMNLPLAERNAILKKACIKITNKDVPEYMKKACDHEILIDAAIQNMMVRIYCQQEGLEFPIDRPTAKPVYKDIWDEIKALPGYDWFCLRQWSLKDVRKATNNYNPPEDLVRDYMIKLYKTDKGGMT